jgi:hypothetical protein
MARVSAVPRRADDLVVGQPFGERGIVAGIEQAIVVERRGSGRRYEKRGGTAEQEGPAARRGPTGATVMPPDRSAPHNRDARFRRASGPA